MNKSTPIDARVIRHASERHVFATHMDEARRRAIAHFQKAQDVFMKKNGIARMEPSILDIARGVVDVIKAPRNEKPIYKIEIVYKGMFDSDAVDRSWFLLSLVLAERLTALTQLSVAYENVHSPGDDDIDFLKDFRLSRNIRGDKRFGHATDEDLINDDRLYVYVLPFMTVKRCEEEIERHHDPSKVMILSGVSLDSLRDYFHSSSKKFTIDLTDEPIDVHLTWFQGAFRESGKSIRARRIAQLERQQVDYERREAERHAIAPHIEEAIRRKKRHRSLQPVLANRDRQRELIDAERRQAKIDDIQDKLQRVRIKHKLNI